MADRTGLGTRRHQFGRHPVIDAPGQAHDSIFIQVWTTRLLGAPRQLGSMCPYQVGDFSHRRREWVQVKRRLRPGTCNSSLRRHYRELLLHDAHSSLAGSISFTVSAYGWHGATAPTAAAATALPPAATPVLAAPRATFHTADADAATDLQSAPAVDAADTATAAFRGAPNCLMLLVNRAWLPARATNAFVEVKVH